MKISYQKLEKTIEEQKYPQNDLLTATKFIKYLENRGLKYSLKDLKLWHKMKLISPIYRIKNIPSSRNKWDGYYFHPYQTFIVYEIKNYLMYPTIRIDFLDWKKETQDNLPNEIHEFFNGMSNRCKERVKNCLNQLYFLFLIEDRYLPDIRGFVHFSGSNVIDNNMDWEKWAKKFNPNKILKKCGFKIENLRRLRSHYIAFGHGCDDLENWKLLVDHISFKKRNVLKGTSRLAQEYYEMAELIRFFIEDITREKEISAFDMFDGTGGSWQVDWYGKRIDLQSKDVLHKILDEYYINPNYKLYLFIEGDTEETLINFIEKALALSLENCSINLYNLGGVDKIQRIEGLVKDNKEKNIISYFILDNEGNWIKEYEKWERNKWVNREYCHVWERNLEEDNFKEEDLIDLVNKIMMSNKSKGNITKRLFNKYKEENNKKNKPLPIKKLIKKLVLQEFGFTLKIEEFALQLGSMLKKDIQKRINNYEPKTEIEKKIIEIVNITTYHRF